MKKILVKNILVILLVGVITAAVTAVDAAPNVSEVYPTAIFPFAERGAGVKGYGEKVSDILFASLVIDPELYLVDRADLEKTLGEHELSLSGIVAPGEAVRVGQLTGAKILLTGSVIEADKTLYVVAKIIGTETSRVFGESVKGRKSDELASLVEELAAQVAETIKGKADKLVAHGVTRENRIAAIRRELGNAERPTVLVSIAERHVGQAAIDPAAETELALLCKETGFDVLDASAGKKDADIVIKGEGFSEFTMRRGNLVSVKARLEVKAIDPRTDRVIAIDRQVAVEVDLSEQIAGKKALQTAAAAVAERMLPKLVTEQRKSEKRTPSEPMR